LVDLNIAGRHVLVAAVILAVRCAVIWWAHLGLGALSRRPGQSVVINFSETFGAVGSPP
jgi:hypothetical protein